MKVLVGDFKKEKLLVGARNCAVLMASVPVSAAGQVCGGGVSSVLRTLAASREQSTSLAVVPGTGGHTAAWSHNTAGAG